ERSAPALRPTPEDEHRADEAAYRPGRADAQRGAVEPAGDGAHRAARDAGAEVEREEPSPTYRALEERADLPQDEEVEPQVQDRAVQEARRHESLEPVIGDREGG